MSDRPDPVEIYPEIIRQVVDLAKSQRWPAETLALALTDLVAGLIRQNVPDHEARARTADSACQRLREQANRVPNTKEKQLWPTPSESLN